MPERQNTTKIPSEEVQGADSWIVVRRPLVEEVEANQKRLDERENAKEGRKSNVSGEYDETCVNALQYVKKWNWVNDAGDPLPPPDTKGVHKLLTDREIEFILKALFGDRERRKN